MDNTGKEESRWHGSPRSCFVGVMMAAMLCMPQVSTVAYAADANAVGDTSAVIEVVEQEGTEVPVAEKTLAQAVTASAEETKTEADADGIAEQTIDPAPTERSNDEPQANAASLATLSAASEVAPTASQTTLADGVYEVSISVKGVFGWSSTLMETSAGFGVDTCFTDKARVTVTGGAMSVELITQKGAQTEVTALRYSTTYDANGNGYQAAVVSEALRDEDHPESLSLALPGGTDCVYAMIDHDKFNGTPVAVHLDLAGATKVSSPEPTPDPTPVDPVAEAPLADGTWSVPVNYDIQLDGYLQGVPFAKADELFNNEAIITVKDGKMSVTLNANPSSENYITSFKHATNYSSDYMDQLVTDELVDTNNDGYGDQVTFETTFPEGEYICLVMTSPNYSDQQDNYNAVALTFDFENATEYTEPEPTPEPDPTPDPVVETPLAEGVWTVPVKYWVHLEGWLWEWTAEQADELFDDTAKVEVADGKMKVTLTCDSNSERYITTFKHALIYGDAWVEEELVDTDNDGYADEVSFTTDFPEEFLCLSMTCPSVNDQQDNLDAVALLFDFENATEYTEPDPDPDPVDPEEPVVDLVTYSVPYTIQNAYNPTQPSMASAAVNGPMIVKYDKEKGAYTYTLSVKPVMIANLLGHLRNLWNIPGTSLPTGTTDSYMVDSQKAQIIATEDQEGLDGEVRAYGTQFQFTRDAINEEHFYVHVDVDAMDGFSQNAMIIPDWAHAEIIDDGNMPEEQIATPLITTGCEFTDSVQVSITCASEGADIYYTTDESVTDLSVENGIKYTGAFAVSETTTVRAIAVKDGKVSALVSETFIKKEVEPTPDDPSKDDPAAIEAGTYTTDVQLWHAQANQPSMGNVAFAEVEDMVVVQEDGSCILKVATKPVFVAGFMTAITEIQSADGLPVTVESTGNFTTNSKFDGEEHDLVYAKVFSLKLDELDPDQNGNIYVNMKMKVPYTPMEAVGASTDGWLDCRLKLNVNELTKAASGQPLDPSEELGVSYPEQTLRDSATGIMAYAAKGYLPESANMIVEPVTSGAAYNAAVASVGEAKFYRISFTDANGAFIEPQGNIVLTLPGANVGSVLYRVSDTGETSIVSGQLAGGSYSASTSTMGLFALGTRNDEGGASNGSSNGASNGSSQGSQTGTQQQASSHTNANTNPLASFLSANLGRSDDSFFSSDDELYLDEGEGGELIEEETTPLVSGQESTARSVEQSSNSLWANILPIIGSVLALGLIGFVIAAIRRSRREDV